MQSARYKPAGSENLHSIRNRFSMWDCQAKLLPNLGRWDKAHDVQCASGMLVLYVCLGQH